MLTAGWGSNGSTCRNSQDPIARDLDLGSGARQQFAPLAETFNYWEVASHLKKAFYLQPLYDKTQAGLMRCLVDLSLAVLFGTFLLELGMPFAMAQ